MTKFCVLSPISCLRIVEWHNATTNTIFRVQRIPAPLYTCKLYRIWLQQKSKFTFKKQEVYVGILFFKFIENHDDGMRTWEKYLSTEIWYRTVIMYARFVGEILPTSRKNDPVRCCTRACYKKWCRYLRNVSQHPINLDPYLRAA